MSGSAGTLEMGATLVPQGVRFRVWAPGRRRVAVELYGASVQRLPLAHEGQGVWSALLPGGGPGLRYKYRLDDDAAFPDPYSRSQPKGVHGPSEVVDLHAHRWQDANWRGLDVRGLVIYECHVGTATPEGTFDALIGQLDRLKRLGVTALQLMPVAEFPGRWNWGYDGVYLFAPTRNYGGVAGLQRLVDAAHQAGLGVILDVVYNHFGPEGNYLRQYSPDYFTDRYVTPWGEAVNYDGPNCEWVRKLVIDNACSWIHDYHLDGLRLDATSKIHDASQPHLLAELSETLRDSLPPERQIVLIAETSENEVRYLLPVEQGGFGFDVIWADDFHHALRRFLLGDHEGYFQDYQGTLEEVARTINQGFLFEGQYSRYAGGPRGSPARDRPAWQLQYCLQTHDQVGNRAFGDRLHHTLDLPRFRAATALLLTLPYTPLLFMGEEFAASSPFLYFTDHSGELGRLITEGRRQEFKDYAAFADAASAARIPDPQAEATFLASKLPLGELDRPPGSQILLLHRELLRLRHSDPVLAMQDRHAMQARALSKSLLAVRLWRGAEQRLLLANFGDPTTLRLPELAGATSRGWHPLLDTEEPRFGGSGTLATVEADATVALPGRSAVLLTAEASPSHAL